jgi:outer membrane protein OmpA-like peptidoglycan-associated protein
MNSNDGAREASDQKKNNGNENVSWPQVIDNIVTKVTGKNMEVTYDFDKLQINFPEVMAMMEFW